MLTVNSPRVVGVPLRTPVAALNVTPAGREPHRASVGVGKPVAVTRKDLVVPTGNTTVFLLVKVAGWFTTNRKACEATAPTPLAAVSWIRYVPPLPGAGVPLSTPEAGE